MKPVGRHPHNNLSVVKVRSLKTPGRYSDGNGLYLEVDSSGAKRWMLRTVVQGKRCDIGLGSVLTVSLAEAREQAVQLRKIARTGGDPLASRKLEKGVPTFEQAARRVHRDHAPTWNNLKHSGQWLTSLESYAFPVIGAMPVSKIESRDLINVLSPIWLIKQETARRVKQRIGTVLDWAQASGFRTGANPTQSIAKGLAKQNRAARHHSALPYADVPYFVDDLRRGEAGAPVRLAFELLILTATRTSETLKAKWGEVSGDVWTVPAHRMKAKQEHRIPLTKRCLEILHEAKTFSDGDYIFPGRSRGTPLSNTSLLETIKRLDRKVTTHGFRSSFKDWATECTNFPLEVSEAALSHTVKDKTERAYRRGDLFAKRRQLMETWESHVLSAVAQP
jgi:integrase